jgi:hypothetical protein
VLFFDVDSGDRFRTLTAGRFGSEKVALSSDGSLLATYGANQDLKIWPLADQLLATHAVGEATLFATLSSDGSALIAQLHRGDIVVLRPGEP